MNNLRYHDFDEDWEEMEELRLVIRRPRVIRERIDFFTIFDETDFKKRFRLSKDAARHVLGLIEDHISPPSMRNNAVSPAWRLLLTLRFYATGSFLIAVADFAGVSVSSACRFVTLVTTAIARLRPNFINMPDSAEAMATVKEKFYSVARFPRVIGAMDCTHVKIISPGGENAETFRNRKGYFSMNVQTVADSTLRILDIVARWPGSVHDQTIFSNSRVKARLEDGEFGNSVILADSGYQLTNHVLTPLLNPVTPEEHLYNESHIRTRNVVERSYGVWKKRFPVCSS